MKYLAFLFFLCLAWQSSAQSPWSAKKNEGFFQLGTSFIGPYNALFTSDGNDFVTSRTLSDLTLQLYGEYGLGKGWELRMSIPFVFQSSGELSENPTLAPSVSEGSLAAFGNIRLGLKKELYNKNFILSAGLNAEIASSSFNEATGLWTGYGAWGIAPSLMFGKGMEKWYAYLNTGPTLRSNGYSAEWRIEAEGGYLLGKRTYLMLNVFLIESFQNGDVDIPQSNLETGFFVNNQSFFSYGPKVLTQFNDKIGLTGAVYLAGSGNMVAKSPSLNLGFFTKF